MLVQRLLARISYFLPGGYTLRPLVHRLRGVRIGSKVWISQFVYIDEIHPDSISIGDNCTIGLKASIIAHFYWGPPRLDGAGPVVIEDNVYIGPHALILPNVTIGEGSVIQGGAVISKDVPPRTIWGMPPATPIGRVTIPLTPQFSYEAFVKGIKPIRRDEKSEARNE